MERTNFEKLQVYQLSEKIAESIWANLRSVDQRIKSN